MSTYTHTDKDGDTLEIEAHPHRPDTAIVTAHWIEGGASATIFISKADVPRVALEILKAAGPAAEGTSAWRAIGYLERAAREAKLFAEAEAARRAEAEAADKARLDQEALTLYKARYCGAVDDLTSITDTLFADEYRAVALAARELHKDGNK